MGKILPASLSWQSPPVYLTSRFMPAQGLTVVLCHCRYIASTLSHDLLEAVRGTVRAALQKLSARVVSVVLMLSMSGLCVDPRYVHHCDHIV